MGIILRGPGIYVPPDILTNDDLVTLKDEEGKLVLDTSDEWIVQRSGIRERRIALEDDVKTLGRKAVRNLQERLGEELKVDEILFATNHHRDGEFPCYASQLADELKLSHTIIHDGLAGCTGLVYGLRDVYNAIKLGDIESGLVGGIERLTDFTDYQDRSTCFLFGDGGGIFKLERKEGKEGIIAHALGGIADMGSSEWPYGHLAIVKKKGKKLKKSEQGFVAYDSEDEYLVMNGQEVFKYATKVMRHAIHEVLAKSPYQLKDLDVIIPHGANIRIIDSANKGLTQKGFGGVIYTNLETYGNTSTASIPLAYHQAVQEGLIREGSLVALVAFGAGFTWGASLLRATLD